MNAKRGHLARNRWVVSTISDEEIPKNGWKYSCQVVICGDVSLPITGERSKGSTVYADEP